MSMLAGDILNDRYVINKKLGSGSFGYVYSGKDQENIFHMIAIKIEKPNPKQMNISYLYNEYNVYRFLNNNHQGFPKFYHFQKTFDNERKFIIIEQLYRNLNQLFDMCEQRFTFDTILEIAIQIIARIETLHSIGFIHRDLKPENFMIGFPQTQQYRIIHLIDFGLCQRYRNPYTMEHFSPSCHNRVVGSMLFMSCNSHFQLKQSRRDDLESLAYLLLYFLNGKNLPWNTNSANAFAKNNPLQHCRKVGSMKQCLTPDELFKNHSKVFANFLSYVRNLDFTDEPDYEMIRSEFIKFKSKKEIKFSWES
ncbi:Casein kinase I isoform gamma-2 [Dermatophagoides pteronyssinus]|uniref:non-specific serine/threonine protein kinase n=1 Tax=Dermatophagoides pteronyssinus TaxID=6956 RepID=A0ABQ8JVN6_DERPT|nr:Casein kinase I isoform gamma-2 [Dermatophagoides pteronyssinus]